MQSNVDCSLYLVTDSTTAILKGRDLCDVVEKAVKGGVTIVQYRDKTSETGVLVETGKKLHKICQARGVPFLINDRVDVALAVGCEGVHIGQDDMDVPSARRILGADKIIGVTVTSTAEADKAVNEGADYLGIGTVYATPTKENTKSIIGVNGVRRILHHLKHSKVGTVCIGGINASNLQRVLFQTHAPNSGSESKKLDGVAVVSAIIGAERPDDAAKHLKELIASPPPFRRQIPSIDASTWASNDLKESIRKCVANVAKISPLSHNMTNLVVQNIAANVALCIGASPIMSNNGEEALDLAKLGGGLVINMGTANPEALLNHSKAIQAYNSVGGPIVLDPVGAGATVARRAALATLMAAGYFDLIKGNEREIMSVARASGLEISDAAQQRGVDSGDSLLKPDEKAYLVSRVARRERNIILMTGSTDYLSDGVRTYAISNGHELLGAITGSGCTLGTTMSAFMAANPEDKTQAALAGIVHFEIAAERAAKRAEVRGPGSFVPAWLDELYLARNEVVARDAAWIEGIKVEAVKDIPDCSSLAKQA